MSDEERQRRKQRTIDCYCYAVTTVFNVLFCQLFFSAQLPLCKLKKLFGLLTGFGCCRQSLVRWMYLSEAICIWVFQGWLLFLRYQFFVKLFSGCLNKKWRISCSILNVTTCFFSFQTGATVMVNTKKKIVLFIECVNVLLATWKISKIVSWLSEVCRCSLVSLFSVFWCNYNSFFFSSFHLDLILSLDAKPEQMYLFLPITVKC